MTKPLLAILLLLLLVSEQAQSFLVDDDDDVITLRANRTVLRLAKFGCEPAGHLVQIEVSGEIGPDTTFLIQELLADYPPAKTHDCELNTPYEKKPRKLPSGGVILWLSSSGGYLRDGIELGRLARSLGATTVASGSCSSSCAIAFLGGRERAIFTNSSLMFHAPYTRSDKDPNKITCSKNLTNVANYYREMLGEKRGERMLDRTKRYCSATDGWIISD